MNPSFFVLATMLCILQPHEVAAAQLNNIDQGNLISAIEDYRFSDYESAIPALETLRNKDPKHLPTLQYLALAYQENEQSDKAAPMFEAWLETNQYSTSEDAKFAWLGLARAYMKLDKQEDAISTLSTWVKANHDDISSQTLLGDWLVRDKKYAQANQIWDMILQHPKATASDKAAAWYYKAWMAYQQNDTENTQAYAQKSLQVDPGGSYANAAKQLEAQPSSQRLGFNGFASLEAFYNSNVKLVPENLDTTSPPIGEDNGIQGTLVLGWGLPKIALSYVLSGSVHQDLTEYDVVAHILSAAWKKDAAWQLKPFYEYISLGGDKLYQSLGGSVYYTLDEWVYQYTLKIKSFNNNFSSSAVDLTRLGGSSHYFGAKTDINIQENIKLTLSPYLITELTKGDATHDKSDSYYQLGGNAITSMDWTKSWNTNLKLGLYSRLYAAADSNILLNSTDTTKRHDNFFQISTSTSWKPWDAYDISLVVNASYLKNISNYDDSLVTPTASKSYSAWRVGSMVTGQW